MVKGYQKRVVFMKNTGSEFFDEAYFVVCDSPKTKSEADMISEANRIIDEARGITAPRGGCNRTVYNMLSFAAGSLLTAISFVICSVFF